MYMSQVTGSIINGQSLDKVWTFMYRCNCCPINCWSDKMSEHKRSISEPSGTCTSKKRKVMNATFQKWQ